ncbi:MAG: ATP-binding protein [Zhaonellaceae bacterium]|jgi:two-component system sensor histidine kinase YcbA
MKRFKKLIGASVVVALASQINIGILNTDFRISAGIVFLAIYLYYNKDLKPIETGLISGIAVYVFRVLLHILGKGNLGDVVFSYQLEILFYTFYGVIYSLLLKSGTRENVNQLFLILVASDFGANLIEASFRALHEALQFNYDLITTLLLVAVVRSSVVWVVITGLKYYKILLLKEEHELRYARLLWLTAQLKSEIYWMAKNMENIERVMSNSYELFEKINFKKDEASWGERALSIAKDVHEIKKEYALVVRGIKELIEDKFQDNGMDFKDIITILDEAMKREIKHGDKDIVLLFETGENFYTTKHYFLMSIFRNLIMNGIDAILDSGKQAIIRFTHKIEGEKHVFIISDTGSGIDETDLNNIFTPGFSTKINYKTGQINRGLGLSVVQDIVERELKGRITVSSQEGEGTTFYIEVPETSLR